MRMWLLMDYNNTGHMQIQANDEHPAREHFGDIDALMSCLIEAQCGEITAQKALCQHMLSERPILMMLAALPKNITPVGLAAMEDREADVQTT
jgi:hypothetical protein